MSEEITDNKFRVIALDEIKAQGLAKDLVESRRWFEVHPIGGEDWEFTVNNEDRVYVEGLIHGGPMIIMYKGQSVRCYGRMNEDQSTWWATDDEEGILPRGFDSWREAVKHFIDQDTPIRELSGV